MGVSISTRTGDLLYEFRGTDISRGASQLVRKMVKVSRGRVSKGRRLQERVRELEGKLAQSVPKTELDAVRSNLQSKIAELQRRLAESVSKTTLDETKKDLQAKILGLEANLRESVPKSEAEALRAKVNEL